MAPENPLDIEVSRAQLADLVGVNPSRVSEWSRDAIIPKPVRQRYNLRRCLEGLFIYYRASKGDKRNTAGGQTYDKEKIRLTKHQADKLELELQIKRGEYAPVGRLAGALASTGTQILAHLDALPIELKRENPELSARNIETVRVTIAKMCNSIADMNLAFLNNDD